MELADLNNPDEIHAILINANKLIKASKNQGWQETKGRYELWEIFDNGLLRLVKSWNKKSVIASYGIEATAL